MEASHKGPCMVLGYFFVRKILDGLGNLYVFPIILNTELLDARGASARRNAVVRPYYGSCKSIDKSQNLLTLKHN